MKKLFSILSILLMFGQASFADLVINKDIQENGKIKFGLSNLILLDQNGVEKFFQREVSDEFFGDTIFYKTKLFGSDVQKIDCRINKINKTNVKFYTEGNKLNKISKLRVKNIVVKIF